MEGIKWEYKLVTLRSRKKWLGLRQFLTEKDVSDLLEGLGTLGWELVSERPEAGDMKYIFKRPKQN